MRKRQRESKGGEKGLKKIGEVELRGGPDETNMDEEDTGTGDDRRRIVVILSEDTVKGKKREPEEVKDRQERILEKRREERWESIRRGNS